MYTVANHRVGMQQKPTKSKMSVFGRRVHHVDIVTVLIVITLVLLNSHYLILVDLTLIIENEQTTVDSSHSHSTYAFELAFMSAMAAAVTTSHQQEKQRLVNQTTGSRSTGTRSPYAISFSSLPLPSHNPYSPPPSLSPSPPSLPVSPSRNRSAVNFISACFPYNGTAYNTFLNNYWFYIDLCLYWLIPFVVMSFCSFIILSKVFTLTLTSQQKQQQNINPFPLTSSPSIKRHGLSRINKY